MKQTKESYGFGGSMGPIGAEYQLFVDEIDIQKLYHSITMFGGCGAAPAEVHADYNYTMLWSYNIYDLEEKLYAKIMEWKKESSYFPCFLCKYYSIFTWIFLFSVATGKANIIINGIAVDSKGFVYVGYDRKINVYNNSELVKKISIPTSRGYGFTIDNDNILLSTGDYTYLMNLDGTVLDKQLDSYENHVYSKYSFKNTVGDSFKVKSILFKTQIVKNNNITVYQISKSDFMAKLFFEISCLSIVIVVPCLIKIFKHSK